MNDFCLSLTSSISCFHILNPFFLWVFSLYPRLRMPLLSLLVFYFAILLKQQLLGKITEQDKIENRFEERQIYRINIGYPRICGHAVGFIQGTLKTVTSFNKKHLIFLKAVYKCKSRVSLHIFGKIAQTFYEPILIYTLAPFFWWPHLVP